MPTNNLKDPKLALLKLLVTALEDKKAGTLRVLDVSAQSSITDYLLLADGNSEPHLRALRIEVEKVLDAAHAPIAGMDSGVGSGWMVVDAYQIMVHLFTPEQRANYALENLWKDAEVLDPVTMQAVAKKLAPAKRAKAAKAAKPAKAAARPKRPAASKKTKTPKKKAGKGKAR